jgi:hypothetical protein
MTPAAPTRRYSDISSTRNHADGGSSRMSTRCWRSVRDFSRVATASPATPGRHAREGGTSDGRQHAGNRTLPADARLLAVEVLLADPGALGNDALESDLCVLRDTLRAKRKSRSV